MGYDAIEVKHIEQPLRGFIFDEKVRLIEEKRKENYNGEEISEDLVLAYDIYDKDWVDWLEKVFFSLHSNSLPAENRIKDLEKISDLFISK